MSKIAPALTYTLLKLALQINENSMAEQRKNKRGIDVLRCQICELTVHFCNNNNNKLRFYFA